MAKQVIGIGTTANDGTGDSLRVSAEKSNDNFTEVYTLLGDGTTLPSGIVTTLTAGTNITLSGSTGNVTINSSASAASTAEVSANTLVVTGVSTLGVVNATSFTGDGSNLTGITTLISAGSNITVTTNSGITTISSTVSGNSTAEVRANTLEVTGVTTTGTLLVGGVVSAATTNYGEVTTTNLSPSSFNATYTRATTGFVLDTGTVSSGNALFHADSNYYYYVASTGSDPEDRILIWSVEDNSWMAVFDFNDPDFSEGNISDNQALGSSGIFSDTLTANSITADGRSVPQASSDIVYSTSGGGSGIGVTVTTGGNALFSGIVTATSFVGNGANLTGITTLIQAGDNVTVTTASGITTISSAGVSTAEVRANTLVVTGITTLGIVTGVTSVQATDFYGNGSELVDGKWTLGANGTDHYTFTGIGFTQTTDDPDLYLARGNVYEFVNDMSSHPFRIQSTQNGSTGTQYNDGVTNNDAYDGTTLKFEVPFNAPDTLYYQCTSHTGMGGTIFIYPTLR